MVARAADLAEPPASYSPTFGNFSATHYPWARRAAYAGLLSGLQGMGPGYDFWAPATRGEGCVVLYNLLHLSLIHISEPTRRTPISYAVFCLKKKKKNHQN